MKIYAISDTHFGHDKLIELSGRPEDFSLIIAVLEGIKDEQKEKVGVLRNNLSLEGSIWYEKCAIDVINSLSLSIDEIKGLTK